MTPLAAGQRWVPTRGKAQARTILNVNMIGEWPIAWDSESRYGALTEADFRAWIVRHAAVLEQDGGGGVGK
jgi:hypothetical protein